MTGKAAGALHGRAEGGSWQEKQAQLKANSGWGKAGIGFCLHPSRNSKNRSP
jgi:hypothetical protein